MKQTVIVLIITLATVSLLGIVFTQLYWVKKAVDLKEEQFNTSVLLAMKGMLNYFGEEYNKVTRERIREEGPNCNIEKTNVTDVVKPTKLDSLIKVEFGCMNISSNYYYGVYHVRSKRFLMGNFKDCEEELIGSTHRISLSSIYQHGNYYLSFYIPNQKSKILFQMIGWIILSAVFLLIVVFSFWYTMYSLLRQKRLSEMKTDFVNNMTHEFKTPISTIQLAGEMLLKPNVYENREKSQKYANVILDENAHLQSQVEQVLQIAILDKGDFKLKVKEVDVHKVIRKITENMSLAIKKRNGKLNVDLNAEPGILEADRIHVNNMITNLLDNACKYSPGSPEISIATRSEKGGIIISVADSGIGISSDNQKDIFKKLYRVPTGNIHDVKGFGLGLYYVKTMTEAHGGWIKLHSELGKGSRFELFLPYKTNLQTRNDEG